MSRILFLLFLLLAIPITWAAAPSVSSVTVTDPISLTAGATKSVECNATVSDADGWANISSVNATLWDITNSAEASADNNNSHYSNTSCSIGTNTSSTEAPVICAFSLHYYANNGTWTCKLNAYDSNTSASNQTNTTVNTLLAVSTPSTIDFGTLSLGDTSTDGTEVETAIENTGNININTNVSGNDMSCSSGSISAGNIKYNDTDNTAYGDMTSLTNSPALFNLNISKSTGSASTKTTFWKISIPSTGVGGSCSNTITFTAISA